MRISCSHIPWWTYEQDDLRPQDEFQESSPNPGLKETIQQPPRNHVPVCPVTDVTATQTSQPLEVAYCNFKCQRVAWKDHAAWDLRDWHFVTMTRLMLSLMLSALKLLQNLSETDPMIPSGKHTKSYWTWPSRNSELSHETWWFSIVFSMFRAYIWSAGAQTSLRPASAPSSGAGPGGPGGPGAELGGAPGGRRARATAAEADDGNPRCPTCQDRGQENMGTPWEFLGKWWEMMGKWWEATTWLFEDKKWYGFMIYWIILMMMPLI